MNRLTRLGLLGLSATLMSTAPALLSQSAAIACPSGTTCPAHTAAASAPNAAIVDLSNRAVRFLNAFVSKDIAVTYGMLTPGLRQTVTKERSMQFRDQALAKLGPTKGYELTKISRGSASSIVEASFRTAQGPKPMLLIFDPSGNVLGYDLPGDIEPAEAVAVQFIQAMAKGDYAGARALISPLAKVDILPSRVEQGWKNLITQAGSFSKIQDIAIIQGDAPGLTLAIVNIKFSRMNDQLFISFDQNNRITNVDYPLNR